MSMSDGDFGLLSPVSSSAAVAALTGDRAVLTAILDVESSWAAVLEEAGLAPAGSAALVAQAADAGNYDVASIAVRAQGGGNPVIPLLADLRAQVRALDTAGIGAGSAMHASLTSQDVLDSALMLLASHAVPELLAEVKRSTAELAALAVQHADTLCVGRSLAQHSLPYTFGLKAAQWFHGVAAAAQRVDGLALPVQFGGAGGTLAAGALLTAGTESTPFSLADALAQTLGLAEAAAPWHTNRLAVTALGDALAALTDSFGKIASDVLFLSRPEVAELGEPLAAGRGGSSAMPQKQNPVLSVLIRSAALQAPGLAAQLHTAAASFNDERPDGAWHSEWPALRQLLRLALGAAAQLRELVEGLRVFPDAMRANLEIAGPLLVSERVAAAISPLLDGDPLFDGERGDKPGGKALLQRVVEETLQAPAAEQARIYTSLLRQAVPVERFPDQQLEALLNPANYLGEAAEISRRILAMYPSFTASDVDDRKGARRG